MMTAEGDYRIRGPLGNAEIPHLVRVPRQKDESEKKQPNRRQQRRKKPQTPDAAEPVEGDEDETPTQQADQEHLDYYA